MSKTFVFRVLPIFIVMYIIFLFSPRLNAGEAFVPFGHPEIDKARKELIVNSIPTNPDNFLERKNTLLSGYGF